MLLSVSSIFFTGSAAKDAAEVKIDSLYRKISFFWFTYNTLQQKPWNYQENFQQVLVGFFERYATKDRTHAIAVGLGVSYNNYIQNLAITGTGVACIFCY
jgi:hypothetical protein